MRAGRINASAIASSPPPKPSFRPPTRSAWYLEAGDAKLTRRAKAGSRTWAVVLRWSKHRKQYERQGLLVEREALAKARAELEQAVPAHPRRGS